tara:strand:- start:4770 stop:5042 length:273 start_codon:yes stop_codon:yes gene_type:complete
MIDKYDSLERKLGIKIKELDEFKMAQKLKKGARMINDDHKFISKLNTGKYELVEDEELFEDGELKKNKVYDKVINHVFYVGDWVVMRKVD